MPDNPFSKSYVDSKDSTNKYVPKTPVEKILAKMNGDNVDVPYPNKPLEYQLKRLADSSAPVTKVDADILDSAVKYEGIGWVEAKRIIFEGGLLPDVEVEISPATFVLPDIGETVTFSFKIGEDESYSQYESTPITAGIGGVKRCQFEGLSNGDTVVYFSYNPANHKNVISYDTTLHISDPYPFSVAIFNLEHKIDERFLPETPEIPEPTAEDHGKIVYVDNSGNYILDDLPTETWTVGLATYIASTRAIAVGTAEFEDGVTDLPTGVIYLQIEE